MEKSKKADTRAGQITNTIPKMAGICLYDTRPADTRGQTIFFTADKAQRKKLRSRMI